MQIEQLLRNTLAIFDRPSRIVTFLDDSIQKISKYGNLFLLYLSQNRPLLAILRGAECLLAVGQGKRCVDWINSSREGIRDEEVALVRNLINNDADSNPEHLDELLEKAKVLAEVEERNEHLAGKRRLLSAFAARNITFDPAIVFSDPESFEWSQIEVKLEWLQQVCFVSNIDIQLCLEFLNHP
ncbi:unnamed protein product [Gongylonema pulchrum]|uniref:TIGR00153 family protein n=1 Tax=Gongylonema pulchrum TaxID=637853 RepID=A0A183ERC0_9BILA|nr:unnamed protein product [Gongylonema pulchrum]